MRAETNHEWREPVRRNPRVAKESYIIHNKVLRSVIFEAVRARPAPLDVSSVQALCRATFSLNIKSKEMLWAAIGAIELFDPIGLKIAVSFFE